MIFFKLCKMLIKSLINIELVSNIFNQSIKLIGSYISIAYRPYFEINVKKTHILKI